ncbi:glucose 1-dehydrogenase [Pseudomonas chengduensis]|uniref:SDR family NAD(P)-dependent oxidoreductase n=1 Tax=Pseudomonas sediminis TaxID=1691904 RepID=UPI002447469B|nr:MULTISPECIES: glucose 1-dehydrogenase [Pseudomonas]MDG9757891.1 glucose 1-dehydrogenase [Pseudomonas sediminis]MDH0624835.1 glucose 1-dehydrogenase [Pseudomonas chengduensis]MDH1664602.1 glucose 1-dehydrogenase [Pseudomonas chengduensis]
MSDVDQQYGLQGKVALVTGAASGLGAATAEVLARAGARVVVSDIQSEAAEVTAQGIRKQGGDAVSLKLDVTSEANWESVVRATVESCGGLDVLVNNAGVEKVALITETSLEDFVLLHDVNVTGVFLGLKHAARAMRPGGAAGRGGSIINLSSVAGLVGIPGLGSYCSSKGAVRLMTKAAAVEFAALGYGIRVNSLHPAIVKTELGINVVRGFAETGLATDEAQAESLIQNMHPLGYGLPQDIASAVLYLASGAARWITGAELAVDGGLSAQ